MSTVNWTRLLQAILAALQVVNGGLSTIHANPTISLMTGAALMGLQMYVHETGVQAPPPEK